MFHKSGIHFIAVVVFTVISTNHQALAVEVDDISASQVELKDSLDVLNDKVNELLDQAVTEASGCDLKNFEKRIFDSLTPNGMISKAFFGGIERFAQESSEIERFQVPIDESIYQGTPLARSFLVYAGKAIRFGGISPSIRLNGQTIGTDKLSHFFETGHVLYSEFLKKNSFHTLSSEQIRDVVADAIRLEDEYLGIEISGVKSFGDIHAHLQGALFWKALLSWDGGWVSCEKDQLKLNKKFDFRSFVQPGWSEAINCNVYAQDRNSSTLFTMVRGNPTSFDKTIRQNADVFERKTGHRYNCPLRPSECGVARRSLEAFDSRLIPYVDSIMSPTCLAVEAKTQDRN